MGLYITYVLNKFLGTQVSFLVLRVRTLMEVLTLRILLRVLPTVSSVESTKALLLSFSLRTKRLSIASIIGDFSKNLSKQTSKII